MNLSSLSNEDLDKIFAAVEGVDTQEAADVYDAIMAETETRNAGNGADIKTGYQIEVQEDGTWRTLDRSAVSSAVFSRFYPTKENAQKTMDRINAQLKDRRFTFRTRQYKKAEYRFVQITTIRKVA